jgi:putative phosphoribosyl transferase
LRAPPEFTDRTEAGRRLGEALAERCETDALVYAIPRGGVPVALEVARALDAPLDLALARKIGAPGNPELALAAVIAGARPRTIINEEVARLSGATAAYLERERAAALAEIERRRRLYLGDRRPLDPAGHAVVLVDDGLATGATARAAAAGLRAQGARRIILAVPTGPRSLVRALRSEMDEVVCLRGSGDFGSVGEAYADFRQVDDEEVVACLAAARA